MTYIALSFGCGQMMKQLKCSSGLSFRYIINWYKLGLGETTLVIAPLKVSWVSLLTSRCLYASSAT